MLNVGLSCPLQGADLSVHSISSLTFDAEAAKKHALSAIIVLEIAHGCWDDMVELCSFCAAIWHEFDSESIPDVDMCHNDKDIAKDQFSMWVPNSMDKVIANVCAEHVMGVGYSCDLKVTCHGRWLFMWFGGAAHVDIVACATTCVCQCVFCPTVLFRAIHWGPFVIVPIWKSSLIFFWR